MFGLRMPELLLILVVILVLFGSSKLPQLGQGLGEGLRSFKKAFRDGKDDEPEALPDASRKSQATAKPRETAAK